MGCKGCPSAKAILDQATLLAPNRSRASDGICSSATHQAQSPNSDHDPDRKGEAHASDVTHDPAHGCDAHQLAEQTRQRVLSGQERRLKYIISRRRIFNPSISPNWRKYSGSNPHDKHAHFSVRYEPAYANDTSWWFTGSTPTPAPSPTPPPGGDWFDNLNEADLRRIIREEQDREPHVIAITFGILTVPQVNYTFRLDPPPSRGRWYISLACRDAASGYACFLREDGAWLGDGGSNILKEWSFAGTGLDTPVATLSIGPGDNDANRIVAVLAYRKDGVGLVSVSGYCREDRTG